MAAFLYFLTELRCRCLPGSASVSLVYEIIQNPTAYDNNKCNSNNTFRCFLRHLAFGTDGIGIESQGIIDLMRVPMAVVSAITGMLSSIMVTGIWNSEFVPSSLTGRYFLPSTIM